MINTKLETRAQARADQLDRPHVEFIFDPFPLFAKSLNVRLKEFFPPIHYPHWNFDTCLTNVSTLNVPTIPHFNLKDSRSNNKLFYKVVHQQRCRQT